MADYRDMAAALGGGYGQDTGPITADTLITLKNGKKATAGDLLGMLKGFGQTVGSNLESLGRGGVASVIGAGGDLESFGRMGINKLYGAGGVNVSPTPVLPTSADILGMMPRGTVTRPETAGMEELGAYMTPVTAKVLKPAVMATGRLAGQEIANVSSGMPSRSLLGDITPKPKQIFIGENAKTWNKTAADQAVEMEKAGAKPTDIWAATGTFRGPEGKLRQEISDVPAQLLNKQKDFEGKLFQALSHEELFKQYPSLQYYDTEIQSQIALPEHLKKTLIGRGKGSFTEKDFVTGEPKIEAQAFSDEDKSILLHELQHAIQAKEGFARGGSPGAGNDAPFIYGVGEASQKLKDIEKAMEQTPYGSPQYDALIIEQGKLTRQAEGEAAMEGYRRLAGEVEARATQERMGMTAEQRRAKFPYESYDVPINDLIVRK